MKPDFKKGDYYQSKNDIGYIDFISSDYITLVVRETPETSEQQKMQLTNLYRLRSWYFLENGQT